MAQINYLKRENNTQKVFLTEDTLNVDEILNDDYGYICDSIKKEGFILKSHECNLFKELVFDEKVVGFCSYDFSREFLTAALNNIYVLPEFRGNGLFLSELLKTMEEHNKPSIVEPTRLVVELLIGYGFAKRINDDIVASGIEFIIPGNHVLSNTDYESSEELSTHFYDLKTCRSIHFLDLEKCHIAYSAPLNYDIIHYDCLSHELDVCKIKQIFIDNEAELVEILVDLEDNLPLKNYTLEEIIGDEDEFSPYIESLIDDAHVTYGDALKIKQQIKEEYEAGMILNESLMIRLAYLFNKNPEVTITSHKETCPYCEMPVDDHDMYCHFCGINLSYNPDEMFNSLITTFSIDSAEKEDVRFVAYKFLKLIEAKIELEYARFTIEKTYGISWSELKSFLNKNSYFNGKITMKGYEFMDTHPLAYYEKYNLDIVNYSDFEKYFYQNPDLDGKTVCINFLREFGDDEDISEIISELNSKHAN